jgi:hypothetical protein
MMIGSIVENGSIMKSYRLMQAFGLSAFLAVGLAACEPSSDSTVIDKAGRSSPGTKADPDGGIFGPGGITLFGDSKKNKAGAGDGSQTGIGVNSFLWRGALDTISFMPLVSADPFGGVIITDWYQPPETPGERVKVHILILDRELRADGVRASVFRQKFANNQGWIDQPVDPKTPTDLENTVLTRARQLRIAGQGR